MLLTTHPAHCRLWDRFGASPKTGLFFYALRTLEIRELDNVSKVTLREWDSEELEAVSVPDR